MAHAGPFLAAALLCEEVEENGSDNPTLRNLVDQINVRAVGPQPPTEMPIPTVPIKCYVHFRAGRCRGVHRLSLVRWLPSGRREHLADASLVFPDDEHCGRSATFDLREVRFPEQGLYWFDVLLSGRQVTRIPLRVNFLRTVLG